MKATVLTSTMQYTKQVINKIAYYQLHVMEFAGMFPNPFGEGLAPKMGRSIDIGEPTTDRKKLSDYIKKCRKLGAIIELEGEHMKYF
jgi:hypothetical protein